MLFALCYCEEMQALSDDILWVARILELTVRTVTMC